MENLKAAFEDVADWCETHLEGKRGREIGMTFGAMLRAYGRLATVPTRLNGERRTAKERELNAKAEKLLMELSTRFLVAYGWVEAKKSRLAEPTSMRTNMIYDSGPRPKE
jgi:hypothetical protein